ncbi:metallophosphoesterase [Georgenia sp. SYP-B2076]|uniref:metallophosphoesterase n=1 Tax=Georgenia sp. SYP-B2076 TaxID=2495881 RepID=UPI0013DF86F4|nr:metallophosphoesterase [Georgenia sp. SYP-B2076]
MTRRGVMIVLGFVLAIAAITGLVAVLSPALVTSVFRHDQPSPAARASQPSSAAEQAAPSTGAGDATTPGTDRPEVRIAVAGDTGTGTDAEHAIAREMDVQSRDDTYDALLLLGDLIYENGDASHVGDRITEPFSPVLGDGAQLVPVLGNHDYKSDEEQQILSKLGRKDRWYTQQVGPVRLIVLDSNRVDDPEQARWLEATLAETVPSGTWTIAAMHHPAYSSGQHGSTPSIQQRWVPLFTKYHVPLVLAGHDHDYERTTPQDGVTYVVSGAGAKLRPVGKEPFTAISTSTLQYLDLAVYGDHLTGTAIDPDGNVLDTFTLTR